MATQETGHAKNVANFEDLISFCTGYGASYNPVLEIRKKKLGTCFTKLRIRLKKLRTRLKKVK